jgi:hypothetical protein
MFFYFVVHPYTQVLYIKGKTQILELDLFDDEINYVMKISTCKSEET